jgi:hypothetical protein
MAHVERSVDRVRLLVFGSIDSMEQRGQLRSLRGHRSIAQGVTPGSPGCLRSGGFLWSLASFGLIAPVSGCSRIHVQWSWDCLVGLICALSAGVRKHADSGLECRDKCQPPAPDATGRQRQTCRSPISPAPLFSDRRFVSGPAGEFVSTTRRTLQAGTDANVLADFYSFSHARDPCSKGVHEWNGGDGWQHSSLHHARCGWLVGFEARRW